MEVHNKSFDYGIAARLVQDKNKLVTKDEVKAFVATSRKFYEDWVRQASVIRELKQELQIAKKEIEFLKVTE